jgi:hypothetical protein
MRRILPLLLLGLLAAPSGASAATYKIGISDQEPTVFTNPLFAPLKMKMARYVTPWDSMNAGRIPDKNDLITWIDEARKTHQRILVAFQASQHEGQQFKAPTVGQYTAAIKRFKTAFPYVKDIQPWNEANRCQKRDPATHFVIGEPICKKPKLAAQYYMAALKVFTPSQGYKVTGLDILDGANINCSQIYCPLKYIRTFLKYAKPHPKFWGIHNYADTNRFDTKRTKALLKATKRGDVWLTETGGIVSLGKNFPYSTKRAARALGCMFTLAKSSRRITRLYVYQFHGIKKGKLFDAGLINPNNTKRPGYDVVKKRKARRCKK